MVGKLVAAVLPSNPTLNRTRNGMPQLAVISFSASRVTPLQAG